MILTGNPLIRLYGYDLSDAKMIDNDYMAKNVYKGKKQAVKRQGKGL